MRRSLLALCTLLLVSSIALPAIASPQPQPVCGPCGTGFENAADREDIELTVIESTATVQIHDDGSATWRVTNTLQNESSAASLRNHSPTLDTIVTYAIRRSSVDGRTENRSARVEGETVVLTFEDQDATTEMPGGVHVVDYLHSGGADRWSVLTADRFTVTGPEGTTVTTDPPGATVTGRNATWHGNGTAKMWDAPRIEQDSSIAFAEPGAAAPVLTGLALTLATLPTVIDVLTAVHLPAVAMFGLLLAGVAAISRTLASRLESPQQLASVVGLAGLVVPLGVIISGDGWNWMATGFAAVSLAMGGLTLARGQQIRPRELTAAGALALAGIALGVSLEMPVWRVPGTLRWLPLVVAPMLGAAVAVGNRRRIAFAWALALVSYLVVVLVVVPPTQQPFGPVVFLLAASAVAAAALSLPFVLLGAAVEPPRRERRGGRPRDPGDSNPEEQRTHRGE